MLVLAIAAGSLAALLLSMLLSPIWLLLAITLAGTNIAFQIYSIRTQGPSAYRISMIALNFLLLAASLLGMMSMSWPS